MKVPYAKPHLTIPDQLILLQARGMVIGDQAKAERYLARLGYYRLSGYWYPARQSQLGVDPTGRPTLTVLDQFRPGTTFGNAVDLYIFDKKLRLMFMDAIERIEVSMRVDIALLLSARDITAHRDPNQLHGNFAKKINPRDALKRTHHQQWLARLDEITLRSKEEFVQRFHSKYTTPLPLWIAIELWDFGLLSHFFAGLKHTDQQTLAAKYGIPRGDLLVSWMRTLNHVRNVAAHHSRLWNRITTEIPRTPRVGEVPLLDHLADPALARERLYTAAAITMHLMRIVSPNSTWGARFKSLIATFPTAPGVELRHAGFPDNWTQLPLWT